MVINEIALFNYGPFKGENRIKLFFEKSGKSRTTKNIILIGGKNGSGKTSIFTAIQLCLYGQNAIGRASRKQYEEYLRSQIHKSRSQPIDSNMAFLELNFDFSVAGKRDNYKIKRIWQINNKDQLTEAIVIQKNDIPLDSLSEKNWQEFVNYLIPPGLLRLFFFDGERINSLTKEDHNKELTDSIESLFGIDVVKQLRVDLRSFERKVIKTTKSEELEIKITANETNFAETESAISLLNENCAQIRTAIDNKRNLIDRIKTDLSKKGYFGGDTRETILQREKSILDEISEKERLLRIFFNKTLPFSYAGEFLQKTLNTLSEEQEIRLDIAYKKRFEEIWDLKSKEINSLISNKITAQNLYAVLNSNKVLEVNSLLHNHITDTEATDIKRWFSEETVSDRKEARYISEQIESLLKELDGLRKQLELKSDVQSEFLGQIQELEALSQECGSLELNLSENENRIKDLTIKKEVLLKEKNILYDVLGTLAAHHNKLGWVEKSIKALQLFEDRLLKYRITQLEQNIHSSLSNLLRKGDLIESIKIDVNNYDIFLENTSGEKINKKKLSEGEQQVLAMSLLSGITKTSGRIFPVIIDTPLGRLDKDHRNNIIHNYFPKASHQLIILSTDTEIDQGHFHELEPYLMASYLFDYDENKGSTDIKEGYFWK